MRYFILVLHVHPGVRCPNPYQYCIPMCTTIQRRDVRYHMLHHVDVRYPIVRRVVRYDTALRCAQPYTASRCALLYTVSAIPVSATTQRCDVRYSITASRCALRYSGALCDTL